MTIDYSALTAASTLPVSSTASSTTGSTANSTDSSVGSQSYFLQLLVAQMNNQDPLNPMDSSQMTSQLAELNTVQGIQQLSTQLTSLLGDVSASQTLQASSLVGKDVLVPGSSIELANGQGVAGVNLSAAADSVTITIKDASGATIHTADLGAQPAGLVNFVWDGTTDAGGTAATGAYTFTVSATTGTAKAPVTASTLSTGIVASVTPGSDGGSVFVNGVGTVGLSQVAQIY